MYGTLKAAATLRAAAVVLIAAAASAAGTAASGAEPYRLGYIVDASGSQQATIKPSFDGLKLYVDQLNRSGGIDGHPLDIVVRDTQSDMQRSVDAVSELSALGVSGIAGLGITSTHGPVYAAAQKVSLPVIAAFPANTPFVLPPAKPNAFGVGLAFNVTGVVAGRFARQVSPNGKRLVCLSFESPGSILACSTITQAAKAQGFSTVETLTVPVSHTDFRTLVDRIVASNPDVVTDCLGRSHVVALLPALTHSAYHGIFLSMDSAIGDDVLRDATPADAKLTVYSYSRYISGKDGTGPQVDALHRAAAQAGIDAPNASLAAGWVMGLVVTDAFKRCGAPCSAKAFNAALEHVDVDTGGLTDAPVRFTAADHYGPTAYRLYRFDARARTFSPVGAWVRVSSEGKIAG